MSASPALLFLFLIGCHPHSNQWVLSSYDRKRGYVFTKDSVRYETTCSGTGYPVLGIPPNEKPDTTPDALPPEPAYDETACEDILKYLHKPIPNLRQEGSILLLIEDKNYRLEFEIRHAE